MPKTEPKPQPVRVVGVDGDEYGTFASAQEAMDSLPYGDWADDGDGVIYTDDQSAGQRLLILPT
jgi:hypothetical protein